MYQYVFFVYPKESPCILIIMLHNVLRMYVCVYVKRTQSNTFNVSLNTRETIIKRIKRSTGVAHFDKKLLWSYIYI